MDNFALYFLLFAIGAFIVPLVSKTIKIPGVVGEILYGIILGYLLHSEQLSDPDILEFLAQMGFIFLMFLAGLEIDFDQLTIKYFFLHLFSLSLFYAITAVIWNLLGQPGEVFGLIVFSTTSVGIIFIALKSARVEESEYGQNLIMFSSMAELFSIIFIILFEVYHLKADNDSLAFLTNIAGFIALFAGAYIMIKLILLFFWWFPWFVEKISDSDDVSETNVRLAFLILMTMVSISALFHLELILGAFLGGLMLSFVFRDKEKISKKLSSIGYGFFIPFFFIKVGWDFELREKDFFHILQTSLYYYGIIFLIRLIFSGFISIHQWQGSITTYLRKTLASATLLSAPLTLLIVVAKLGEHLDIIDTDQYSALIVTAMGASLIGPITFQLLFPGKRSEAG